MNNFQDSSFYVPVMAEKGKNGAVSKGSDPFLDSPANVPKKTSPLISQSVIPLGIVLRIHTPLL